MRALWALALACGSPVRAAPLVPAPDPVGAPPQLACGGPACELLGASRRLSQLRSDLWPPFDGPYNESAADEANAIVLAASGRDWGACPPAALSRHATARSRLNVTLDRALKSGTADEPKALIEQILAAGRACADEAACGCADACQCQVAPPPSRAASPAPAPPSCRHTRSRLPRRAHRRSPTPPMTAQDCVKRGALGLYALAPHLLPDPADLRPCAVLELLDG